MTAAMKATAPRIPTPARIVWEGLTFRTRSESTSWIGRAIRAPAALALDGWAVPVKESSRITGACTTVAESPDQIWTCWGAGSGRPSGGTRVHVVHPLATGKSTVISSNATRRRA